MHRHSPVFAGLAGAGRALLAVFALCLAVTAGASAQQRDQLVTIVTASGTHDYTVELALTAEQRAVGLMNRESMAEDHGMLFRFETVRPITMWMRNTLIPLDMIFIREDGTVAGFHENAEPLSESIIASPEPVKFVLELNGGKAAEIGLAPGDTVQHPFMQSSNTPR
jgi:uncharacterized protein